MTAFLRFEAYDPAQSGLTIIDSSVPVPANPTVLLDGADWGNAVWEATSSGPRGSLGSRRSGSTPKDRQVSLPFRMFGSSKQDVIKRMSVLAELVDTMRRYGGRIVRREHNQTSRQYLDVLDTPGVVMQWDRRFAARDVANVVCPFTCAPFALGDAMDVDDDFSRDTVNGTGPGGSVSYIAETGSLATVKVDGGVATFTSGTETLLLYNGYDVADVMVAAQGNLMTVIARRTSPGNYLKATYGGTTVTLQKVVGGTPTTLTTFTVGLSRTHSYFAMICNGDLITLAQLQDISPGDGGLGLTVVGTFALAEADKPLFGGSRAGKTGFGGVGSATSRAYRFRSWPFTWLQGKSPEQLTSRSVIPGDAPALGVLRSRADVPFGMVSWGGGPVRHLGASMSPAVGNGTAAVGWSAAAVAGVTGAATSVIQNASSVGPADGSNSLPHQAGPRRNTVTIAVPATANVGGTYQIWHAWRKGKQYVALHWNVFASISLRNRLGVSGDIASSAATTQGGPVACVWSPAADLDGPAYFAVESTTATAGSLYVAAPLVFEARPGYIKTAVPSAVATTIELEDVPKDWPAMPFFALVGTTEIVQVTSFTGTTLTVKRGVLSSTAQASHAAGVALNPLPAGEGEAGLGAMQAIGVAPVVQTGESGTADTFTANSAAKYGTWLQADAPSAPAIKAYAFIEPALDDTVAGDTAPVELWARFRSKDLGAVKIVASCQTPDGAAVIGYTEYGTAGRTLPTQTVAGFIFWRIGTIVLPKKRTRIELDITNVSGTSTVAPAVDLIVAVDPRRRVMTPSGKNGPLYLQGYPSWHKTGADRIVNPDLSGSHTAIAYEQATAPPVGGTLIEIEPGTVSLLAKFSAHIADITQINPVSADEGNLPFALHLGVTPRWAILRDA